MKTTNLFSTLKSGIEFVYHKQAEPDAKIVEFPTLIANFEQRDFILSMDALNQQIQEMQHELLLIQSRLAGINWLLQDSSNSTSEETPLKQLIAQTVYPIAVNALPSGAIEMLLSQSKEALQNARTTLQERKNFLEEQSAKANVEVYRLSAIQSLYTPCALTVGE